MSHPKGENIEENILELKQEGKSNREISRITGVPHATVDKVVKRKYKPMGDIPARVVVRTLNVNPWVMLYHRAAVEYFPELKDVSLEEFIFYCCDCVKNLLKIPAPGWAASPPAPLDLREDPSWQLPQVAAAAERLAREAQHGQSDSQASEPPKHKPQPGFPSKPQPEPGAPPKPQPGRNGGGEGPLGEGGGKDQAGTEP